MVERVYTPRKLSRIRRVAVRDVDYLVRTWGPPEYTPLVLLHGAQDTSVTFQFLVDSLEGDWHVVAPDWRGHGGTSCGRGADWFHDYLADLDALLKVLYADRPVDLVGHSLGGNLASVFSCVRPERVRRVISLDAFGILGTDSVKFVDTLARWIQIQSGKPGPQKFYRSIEHMAHALCRANPRLRPDQALYLATHSSRGAADAGFAWCFDVSRRRSMPTFHSLDEWVVCWSRILAPALWVAATDPRAGTVRADPHGFDYVLNHIGRERVIYLPDTGHNVQHDAPGPLAKIIETFLTAQVSPHHNSVAPQVMGLLLE